MVTLRRRRVTELVVVYDVGCPSCSTIARELPELVRVPVTVRSCRDPGLACTHPELGPAVRSCETPAVGTVRADGTVRWWPGLTGVAGLAPVVRPRGVGRALGLLRMAWRTTRARGH